MTDISLAVLDERVKHLEEDVQEIKEAALTIDDVRTAVTEGVKQENDATMADTFRRLRWLTVVLLFTGIGTILTKTWENL